MLTLAYSWANHLTESPFYNKVLDISCNLLKLSFSIHKLNDISWAQSVLFNITLALIIDKLQNLRGLN